MHVTSYKVTLYKLNLNEAEIIWLRDLMQNPIYDPDYRDEDEDNKIMRETFWDALNSVEVKT